MSVLIDYSKAFDTIHHETLLKKLMKLNFSRKAIKVIMSFITNRQQFVQNEDPSSSRLSVHFRVPQESILGPTIFNTYVSELPDDIKSDSIQYADDLAKFSSLQSQFWDQHSWILKYEVGIVF